MRSGDCLVGLRLEQISGSVELDQRPVGFLQFIPNSSGGFFGQLLRALFSLTKSQMLVAPERISAKLRQHEHGRENEQRLPDEARLAVLSFGATFAHFEIDDNAAKRGCMSCFC